MTSKGLTAIALPTLQSVEEIQEASLFSFNDVILLKGLKWRNQIGESCKLRFLNLYSQTLLIKNIIKST